jgi:hypothetical protein
MRLRIFIGLVFFAICILALGRIFVQTVRRPLGLTAQARPTGPVPRFAGIS